MPAPEIFRLIVLSAIWGGSFLFLRVAVPEFGPIPLIWLRVTLAAICLSPLLFRKENREALRNFSGGMLVMAALGTALPFCLLAYATLTLEVGMTAVINAMTPVFTMLVTLFWIRKSPAALQLIGLAIGITGVVVLSWDQLSFANHGGGWAVLAALLATMCYGVTTNFLKIRMPFAPAQAVAFGSMAGASLILMPLAWFTWPDTSASARGWVSVVLLATVSTAVAYLLFFRLVTKVSALAATSVTFLVPVFAFLWGAIFLGEGLSPRALIGMLITMGGTALTLGLWRRKRTAQAPQPLDSNLRSHGDKGA
jgi:drug/metabolite transporter (DMT)-like permease